MSGKLAPKQIAQDGATNGQVLSYDTALAKWKPANAGSSFGIKAGTALNAAFSGNPKTAAVTFTTPYANTNYSVAFAENNTGGGSAHNITINSKTATGFTINANTNNITGLIEILWQTQLYGEQ